MTLKLISLSVAAVLVVGMVFAILTLQSNFAAGSAPIGLAATQQVATTTEVGPEATVTLFANRGQNCSARIVSTINGDGQSITLLFADTTNNDVSSTTLSGVIGHFQAASTTVMYDGGLYGCGRMTAQAYSSTTITISEFR